MIGRIVIFLGLLLLASGLAACGTIEIGLANDDDPEGNLIAETGSAEDVATSTAPVSTATESPAIEPSATPLTPAATPTATVTATTTTQDAPAGWTRFYADEYGIELWHPPGTTAIIDEPSRPEFSSVDFPEGIVEEQVFVVRVMQEEGGPFGPPGPQAILQVKLVTNDQGKSVAQMAELYSKRCPGPLSGALQPTTVNVQLSGYRYGCEGIDGIIFNEFWAPHPSDPQLLFGAAWADMSAPLSDEILATVAFTG